MKILFLSTAILALSFTGCTDAFRSQLTSYNAQHHIELWSGGKKVKEWTSTGKVKSEESSDGYYFKDSESQELVRVTGDLVITPIE